MTTVATAVPDDLHVQAGEEIDFHALVLADGSFLVQRVLRREPPKPNAPDAPATLGEWGRKWAGVAASQASAPDSAEPLTLTGWARKWAGTMKLAEGETRKSLRDTYMKEKFGA